MKVIDGGVTAAKGFEAAGAEAAIKYQNRKDMAMVYSKVPCKAAGTFTANVVKAAPVLWDRDIVANSEYAQAVVVNAGIANACTGKQGLDYLGFPQKQYWLVPQVSSACSFPWSVLRQVLPSS